MCRDVTGSLAVLLLVLFGGCVTDPKSLLCQPSTQTLVDGGSTVAQTYSFEGGKLRLIEYDDDGTLFRTAFEYDFAGDLSKSIQTVNGESLVTTYSYNIQHFLIASQFTHDGDTVQTTYEYNDVGQWVRQNKNIVNASGTVTEKYYYFYPDLVTHNPWTIATVTPTDSVLVYYEYDNKINPERELFLPTIQPYNNITRVTAPGYTYTVSYQYDGNGYPVSSISSNGITRTWTYNCAKF
jgi:hypothetical protein